MRPTWTLFSSQDILNAMKALGLNPAEQEVIDMTNEVANNGLVYFPDFCRWGHTVHLQNMTR
jgi:hypothetical protein